MKIVKVLRPVKYGEGDAWVSIEVQLDHGGTAWIWVGGEVDEWPDDEHNRTKAFVLRKPKTSIDK